MFNKGKIWILAAGLSMICFHPGYAQEKGLVENLSSNLNQDVIDRLKHTPPRDSKFTFVVMGDIHSREKTCKKNFPLINALKPAFVIGTGDFLNGYNDAFARKEWQEYMAVEANLAKVPVIKVAGNHDVWNIYSSKIFKELFGPKYFSYTYGNSHFIILDTEDYENNSAGAIRGPQLEWLKEDLKEHGNAENIFVFMHQPIFEFSPVSWEPIHRLLIQYPVKVVFGAHWHEYCFFEKKDNIRYIISGGGGGGLRYWLHEEHGHCGIFGKEVENIDTGGFFHFVIVQVNGSNVSIKVQPTNSKSLLPEDCVTHQDDRAQWRIPAYYSIPTLRCKDGAVISDEVKIIVKNPTDIIARSSLIWNVPAGWTVSPRERTFEIPPHGETTITFSVTPPDAQNVSSSSPAPAFEARHSYGDGKKCALVLDGIIIAEQGECPYINAAPKIDADLSDWRGIPLFTELTTKRTVRRIVEGGKDWNGPSDLSGRIFLSWDKQNFYFAAAVTDNIFIQDQKGENLWRADSISLGFDILNDARGRIPIWSYNRDDCEIILALTPEGPQAWCLYGQQKGLMKDITLSILHEGSKIVYEAAIPWKVLNFNPERGKIIGFNIAIHDSDGKGNNSQAWTSGLTPDDAPSPAAGFGDLTFTSGK